MKTIFAQVLALLMIFMLPGCTGLAEATPTEILLTSAGAEISGPGAAYEDGTVLIDEGGSYRVTGSSEGTSILVNAKGAEVTIILDGADIAAYDAPAVYVQKAERVILSVPEGATATLADGSTRSDDEADACIYSKGDLLITGPGELIVTGNYKIGVSGKDTLALENANLTISAPDHGLSGKDGLTVSGSTIAVTSGGDGLRTTNSDEGMGELAISDSMLTITSTGDGIQSEGALTVENSAIAITSGGGGRLVSDSSAKGVKSEDRITVLSGEFRIDSADDAVHAVGLVAIAGGSWTVSSSDDAFHSDTDLVISGGTIEILASLEGIESNFLEISGGEIRITSTDDGINAAGDEESRSWQATASSGSAFVLSGGSVYVNAGGDGVDSNGEIEMTGGTLAVSGSSDSRNGAIDFDREFTLSGGVLFAAGDSAMARVPTDAAQPVISVTFDEHLPAGTPVAIAGGGMEFLFVLENAANHVVFSSPDLIHGETYTVSIGGTFSGTTDGPFADGSVIGGREFCQVVPEKPSSGGPFGGHGDFPGTPGGNPPERPDEETPPEMPEGAQPGSPFPGSRENPFPSEDASGSA